MVVLQAESEVAAINMVYGGAGAGKRVITTSSSPGVALMHEGISYMAGAEIPGVIINVQRGYSGKTATSKNCFNSGSVSAGGCAGGICGSGYDTYYIQNCANIGTVTGDQDYASICGQPSTSSSTG